jgi:hypothetical protein
MMRRRWRRWLSWIVGLTGRAEEAFWIDCYFLKGMCLGYRSPGQALRLRLHCSSTILGRWYPRSSLEMDVARVG